MPTRALYLASLGYLLLPNLLFIAGWLGPAPACLIAAATLAGIWLAARDQLRRPAGGVTPGGARLKPWMVAVFVLAVALYWLSFSGIGGVGLQNGDYDKHNAILKDLMQNPWPVVYASGTLTYYIAFYLPAALVGKALGWAAAQATLFIWGALGAWMALLWFTQGVKRWPLAAPVFFALFGGLDLIGWLVVVERVPHLGEHIQWWNRFFQYTANTTLVFWVPQHCFAGWIGAAMVKHVGDGEAPRPDLALVIAATALWSPFVTLGLVPLAVLALRGMTRRDVLDARSLLSAPALVLMTGLYLASNRMEVPKGFMEQRHLQGYTSTLVGFLLLEVGLYAWCCQRWLLPSGRRHDAWFYVALAILLLLPFYRLGERNDFVMRASIPALFLFWQYVAQAVSSRDQAYRRLPALLWALVLVGFFPGASEIRRAWSFQLTWRPPALAAVTSVPHLDPPYAAKQYQGSPDSLFFRYLAAGDAKPPP